MELWLTVELMESSKSNKSLSFDLDLSTLWGDRRGRKGQ